MLGLLLALAQLGAPRVEVNVYLEMPGVPRGGSLRAAVEVRLPSGYHVNSHEPLEKFLIPTALELDLPAGVRVEKMVYPEAIRLKTNFSDTPLLVYEHRFWIGVIFEVEEEAEIPGNLRYQACDEKACYRPASEEVRFELKLVPKDTKLVPRHREIFDSIQF